MDNQNATVNYGTKSTFGHVGSTDDIQAADTVSDDWTGKAFGEYQVGILIGEGGNGRVYRATHRWLELPVAIKVLLHIRGNHPQTVDRFRREAMVAARMNHPNIVRCTDGGVVGNQLFLVTDFVDGSDLRKLVAKRGALSIADACEIARQAALALDFIARRNTVHRDIKPSNIMLDRDGVVRILDLGLARSSVGGDTITETGQVMGTIDYMAPEQAVDARSVDSRADMYSLGCTLYFLLTGRAPFAGGEHDSVASKLLAHLETEAEPLTTYRRDVPGSLTKLIERMLSKEPEQRPSSFADVIDVVTPLAKRQQLPALLGATAAGSRTETQAAVHRIGESVDSATAGAIKWLLVSVGVLQRTPPARPGYRPTYSFSLRWLKGLFALGFIAFVIWMTGIEFVPADSPGATQQPSLFGPPSYHPPPHHGGGPPPHPPGKRVTPVRFNTFK